MEWINDECTHACHTHPHPPRTQKNYCLYALTRPTKRTLAVSPRRLTTGGNLVKKKKRERDSEALPRISTTLVWGQRLLASRGPICPLPPSSAPKSGGIKGRKHEAIPEWAKKKGWQCWCKRPYTRPRAISVGVMSTPNHCLSACSCVFVLVYPVCSLVHLFLPACSAPLYAALNYGVIISIYICSPVISARLSVPYHVMTVL